MEIVLIGSGNIATHLGLALQSQGIVIKQVYSRNADNAEKLATRLGTSFVTGISNLYMNADIYIFALKDSALKSVLRKMNIPDGILVHTAGSVPMSDFDGFTTRSGVLYPLQSFSIQKKLILVMFLFASKLLILKFRKLWSIWQNYLPIKSTLSIRSAERKYI